MKLHDSQFKILLIFLMACLGAASQFILQSFKVNFLLIGCFSESVDIISRQLSSYSYTIFSLRLFVSVTLAESRKNCQKLCQKVWNLSFGLTAITCTYAELIIWNCIHTFRHLSDHRWHKYIFKKDALNNEGRFYLESGATQTSGAASAQTDATKDGFISQEKMYVDHGIIDSESVWR